MAAPAVNGITNSATLLAQDSAPALGFGTFGARLLASSIIGGNPGPNSALSPASAGLTLSLAWLGARGTTATAVAEVLAVPRLDRQALVDRGSALLAASRERSDVQLEMTSAIWVDTSVELAPAYATSAARWHATAETLSLSSPEAMTVINRWADRSTHGRIKDVLNERLPDGSKLLLTNAVYFKGEWADAFDERATGPRDFLLASGRRTRVSAMERTGQLAYRRAKDFQVVRLPYRGGRVAMYVILPDSGVTAPALMQQFAAQGWPSTFGNGEERDIHLVLPRFHVEQTIDLKPLLEGMGAGIAFDCRRADFGDLVVVRSSGTSERLCIEKAVQKVYLDVNEKGTEAAAVTGMALVDTSAPPPPLNFIVDRPFLFVLRDEQSGVDLFVGSIGQP